MRYIDADRLIKLLKEQKVKETGAYTKGINSGLNVAKCIFTNTVVTCWCVIFGCNTEVQI